MNINRNNWKPETFKPREIQKNLENKTFIVPRYQRGIVWKDQQKSDLVDTIKRGLPFGSLLLYADTNNTYQIIDGLQRSTAIKDFVNNPAQFFNEEDIDDTIISQLLLIIGVSGNSKAIGEQIRTLLIKWVKQHASLDEVEGMQFSRFGQYLSSEFPTCKGRELEIGDLITPMLKNFQDICKKINDIDIPAIVISGNPDSLPILFERINSKGTQLSKYQIYAASWNDDQYVISDNFVEIVKANRDRYDLMLGGEATIDDYDSIEFLNSMCLNAFEIAFGFGKYLRNNWPHLFGDSDEDIQIESVGFNLINCCLGAKNKDVRLMNTRLKKIVGTKDINVFIEKIVDAVRIVDHRLGKYSQFKSNSRADSGKRPLHTEFQIISIIASVFLSKYADISYDETDGITDFKLHLDYVNDVWKTELESAIKKNLSKIYIMEILQQRWAGSGDKKMDGIITNLRYYARDIAEEEFRQVLENWFNSLNLERSEYRKIPAPKEPELLIIAAVYLMNQFSADKQMDDSKYDIEHLATKALMREHLDKFDGQLRLPISSIGNLCLLPQFENRSKGKKTIYQDSDYLSKTHVDMSYIENNYSFTKKEDLEWIEDSYADADDLKSMYLQFISKRFSNMVDILIANFNKL